MKKSHLIVVLTLTCLLGLDTRAHAQDTSTIVVTVPFEFVVGAKVLPAGKYSISRVFPDSHSGLIIRSYGNGAVMLPIVVDGAAKDAGFSFEHVGNEYFLSKVETPAGVYTIETPGAITKLAHMQDHNTQSSSGN